MGFLHECLAFHRSCANKLHGGTRLVTFRSVILVVYYACPPSLRIKCRAQLRSRSPTADTGGRKPHKIPASKKGQAGLKTKLDPYGIRIQVFVIGISSLAFRCRAHLETPLVSLFSTVRNEKKMTEPCSQVKNVMLVCTPTVKPREQQPPTPPKYVSFPLFLFDPKNASAAEDSDTTLEDASGPHQQKAYLVLTEGRRKRWTETFWQRLQTSLPDVIDQVSGSPLFSVAQLPTGCRWSGQRQIIVCGKGMR